MKPGQRWADIEPEWVTRERSAVDDRGSEAPKVARILTYLV